MAWVPLHQIRVLLPLLSPSLSSPPPRRITTFLSIFSFSSFFPPSLAITVLYPAPLPPPVVSLLSSIAPRGSSIFSPLFVAALPPSSLKSKIAHQESQVASRQGRHSVTKQSKVTSTDRRKKSEKNSRKERKTTQKTKGNPVANKRIVSIITRLILGRLYLITIHFRLCQLHPF